MYWYIAYSVHILTTQGWCFTKSNFVDRSWGRTWHKRKLQPCWSWLKLLKHIWEGNSDGQSIICGHINVYNKILSRNWSKQAIKISASQSQGLSASARKLNKVAGRNWTSDSVHCAFRLFVLNEKMYMIIVNIYLIKLWINWHGHMMTSKLVRTFY